MNHWVKTILCLVSASLLSLQTYAAGEGERAKLGDYFVPATAEPVTPDSEGFIRRWTILEPIAKSFNSNSMLTDNYLSETMAEEYFKDQYTVIPVDGAKVKYGKSTLLWHALDSKKFFVNLLRFAEGFGKDILEAVALMTHEDDVPYLDYVAKLKDNPIARAVKLADLAHNSDFSRIGKIDDETRERLEKYKKAKAILEY